MHFTRPISAVVCLFVAALCLAEAPDLPLRHERFVLTNGLTVIVNEDRSAPLVTVRVAYRVGSRNEPTGKTGFAHLFEHLMFNGSEHYDGEWMAPLLEAGAVPPPVLGGVTQYDSTNYYQTVPTPALDRVLWMESDRMGHFLGALTQAKLDEQRGVVQNEARQYENEPYGRLQDRLFEALFPPEHPYHHSILGSLADLNAASLRQMHQWFRDYYGPNNAAIVLSGDIDLATARAKVGLYFGDIPPGPRVDTWTQWLPTRAHDTRDIQYDTVSSARVRRSWVIPGRATRDFALLSVAAAVLGEGRNSLLGADLVHHCRVATATNGFTDALQLASVFSLQVDLNAGVDAAVASEALDRVLAGFMRHGPSRVQLERAAATITSRYLDSVGFGFGRASALADGYLDADDPGFLQRYLARVDTATVNEVRAVARQYLGPGSHQITVLPRGEFRAAPSGVDRTKGMPVVPDGAPVAGFPEVQILMLSNGARLVVAERTNTPQVLIGAQFDAGNAADHPAIPGLASFALDMLDEGTRSRDAQAIFEQAGRLGADITLDNDLDSSAVNLIALPDRLEASVALWADIIRNAAFDDAAIERVRAARLAALRSEQTDPERTALRILRRLSFGAGHSYGAPRRGSIDEASLHRIDREALLAFRRDWLRPDNVTIFVVGNVTMNRARVLLESALGKWHAPSTPLVKKTIPEVAPPAVPRLILVDRPGAPQSLILGGSLAAGPGAANDSAIEAMNNVLGAGFTSRLNMNLREDKHWSYGVGSGMADARGQRSFQVNAPVQTDKTAAALAELIRELTSINTDRPISDTEMKSVVTTAVRQLPSLYESARAIFYRLQSLAALGRPFDYPNSLPRRYQALTLADLRSAAREVIQPHRMIWIVVGDRDRIEAPLAALNIAPIEHWQGP